MFIKSCCAELHGLRGEVVAPRRRLESRVAAVLCYCVNVDDLNVGVLASSLPRVQRADQTGAHVKILEHGPKAADAAAGDGRRKEGSRLAPLDVKVTFISASLTETMNPLFIPVQNQCFQSKKISQITMALRLIIRVKQHNIE